MKRTSNSHKIHDRVKSHETQISQPICILLYLCLVNLSAASSTHFFQSPEGDGFEGPLSHSTGLFNLCGLQVVSHVLEPQQGAVGGSEEQPLEGGRVLGPQAWIHQLSLPLHQSFLCRLFLLFQLVTRLLLGLKDKKKRKR